MVKRIVIAPDANGNDEIQFWNDNALVATVKEYDQTVFFSRPINDGGKFSQHTLVNGGDFRIHIGDKRYDRAYFIDYVARRGTEYQAGRMIVIYKEGIDFNLSQQIVGDIPGPGVTFNFSIDENKVVLTASSSLGIGHPELQLTTKTIGKMPMP